MIATSVRLTKNKNVKTTDGSEKNAFHSALHNEVSLNVSQSTFALETKNSKNVIQRIDWREHDLLTLVLVCAGVKIEEDGIADLLLLTIPPGFFVMLLLDGGQLWFPLRSLLGTFNTSHPAESNERDCEGVLKNTEWKMENE